MRVNTFGWGVLIFNIWFGWGGVTQALKPVTFLRVIFAKKYRLILRVFLK